MPKESSSASVSDGGKLGGDGAGGSGNFKAGGEGAVGGARGVAANDLGTATAAAMRAALDPRQRPLTDDELDTLLPTDGFEIMKVPDGYEPLRPVHRRVLEATEGLERDGFVMQAGSAGTVAGAGAGSVAAAFGLQQPEDESLQRCGRRSTSFSRRL